MKHTLFKGACTALVTPMDEKGVNFDALKKMLDFQLENKIDAVVVCGTTGEAPTLEDHEHLSAIEFCADYVKGRIPVIAGTGSNYTEHAVMMNKEAEKLGADGLLWVTPYYNKTTQRGLYEHYSYLASKTSLPAILYNVPSRTGVNLLPETVEKLSSIENIVAVKEASGSVKATSEIIERCGDKIDVYSGDDDLIVPLMSMGAIGVISVLSNIMPKETHDLCCLCFDEKYKQASKKQIEYAGLIRALFCEVNPIPVKTALNLMGFNAGKVRLPLFEMEEKNLDFLKKEMAKHGLI